MIIYFTDGTIAESNEAGDPIPLNGREIDHLIVDRDYLIQGAPTGIRPYFYYISIGRLADSP